MKTRGGRRMADPAADHRPDQRPPRPGTRRSRLGGLALGAAALVCAPDPAAGQDDKPHVLFPRGPAATVPWTGPNIGDYELVFVFDNDPDRLTAAQARVTVSRVQGTGFTLTPLVTTPAQFPTPFPRAFKL